MSEEKDNLDLHYFFVKRKEISNDELVDFYVETIVDIIRSRNKVKQQLTDLIYLLVDEVHRRAENELLFEDIYTKINLLNAKHIVVKE